MYHECLVYVHETIFVVILVIDEVTDIYKSVEVQTK